MTTAGEVSESSKAVETDREYFVQAGDPIGEHINEEEFEEVDEEEELQELGDTLIVEDVNTTTLYTELESEG